MSMLKFIKLLYREILFTVKNNKGKVGILIIETLVVTTSLMWYTLSEFHSNNPYYYSNEIYNIVYFLEKKDIINKLTYNNVHAHVGSSGLILNAKGEIRK